MLKQSDVIVNPTSRLYTGTISKHVFQKSGSKVIEECRLMFQQGITEDDVAVTLGGDLKKFKNIFHVCLPKSPTVILGFL